ncbi:helix-turn-helix domain-containing protein [Cryptosporangium sp. NPDC048952]|uniref:nSTAND1 domain-containing NTPase n=1 Tax=Cryptosporangium sp. NPDC048952 TaxID=3363961 RepID=UPI00371321A8
MDSSWPEPQDVNSREEFAAALTGLRERAGRTVRDVAKLTGVPASTVGGYFGGRHLPPLKPVDALPRLLEACGVHDPAEVAAWVAALNRIRRAPGPRPSGAPAPYLGLASFQPEDTDRFFGREELTATILDQFEEVFTLCADETERSEFLRALGDAPTLRVVLGLRADFYADALRVPLLAAAAEVGQVIVPPMSVDGLRRAIVEPARRDRMDVEEGFVDVLLRDTGHEAGSLPLLSHVLLATYELGRGRRLTLADYHATGGLHGAVARTAENAYAELDPDEQDFARRLFLRLVQVSDHGSDTRRRAPIAEIQRAGSPVLDRFVRRRLITVEQDAVSLSHEALLSAWPRLREWLDADRSTLIMARRLAEAAEIWDREQRDPAALYRGARLVAARDWLAAGGDGPLVSDFVEAGLRRERRRNARLYQTVAVLIVLLLVAVAGVVVAVQQRRTAETERNLALSRLVAIRADRVRQTDVPLAAQLSLVANRIADTPEARASLIDASATTASPRMLGGNGVMQSISVSPRKRLVAAGSADTTVRLWDVTDPAHPRTLGTPLTGPTDVVYTTAFSPDGRLLAAGSGDHRIRLWDIADPHHPRAVAVLGGPAAVVYSVAFSPDGRLLAAGSGDNTVRLYDVGTHRPVAVLDGLTGFAQAVAFRPDGRELSAGLADGSVQRWDVTAPARPVPRPPLTGPDGKIFAIAYSPDGRTLAAGSADTKTYLWNQQGTVPERLAGTDSWINGVAFNDDATKLAVASSDGTAQVWDLARRVVVARLIHPGPVTAVTFDGTRLLTSAADGVARVWHLPGPVLTGLPGTVNMVAFRPDGAVLAVAGHDVSFFDPRNHQRIGTPMTAPDLATSVGYSPDGRTLAVGFGNGAVRFYDVTDPRRPVPHGQAVVAPGFVVESLMFSPDGRSLATGSDDGTVQVWNVEDPARSIRRAVAATFKSYVYTVRFSPDGALLAAGSVDKTARLVDVSDPDHPRALGGPLRGPDHYVMALTFSPDGRTLAMGSGDHTARLYDVTDPVRPRRTGPVLEGPNNYVYALSFSPDGHMLAGAVTDGTVSLWNTRDLARPELLGTLTASDKALYTVAFARDGQTVAAAGRSATVWLWTIDPKAAARLVCRASGDGLTRAEWAKYVPSLPYRAPCP